VNLRAKLLLAQLPLGVSLAVVGVLAVLSLSTLGDRSDRILSENYRSVLAAQRMNESLERLNDTFWFRALGETREAQVIETTHRARFAEELAVEEGNITEGGELEVAQALRDSWLAYLRGYDALLAASPEEVRQRYPGELEPVFLKLKTMLDTVLNLNQDAMVRKSEEAKRSAVRLTSVVTLAALCAILLGIAATLWLSNRILRPLKTLWSAAQRIGEGDLNARVRVVGRDEIAQLAREFNAMTDRLGQYRQSSLGELLAAQESAQAAIDALPDPVFILDLEGRVENLNRAASRLVKGVDAEDEALVLGA
jgi:methyl-accepting chemotaxis protein